MGSDMIVHDDRDLIIAGLRGQVSDLQAEVVAERSKNKQTDQALRVVREILTPLYKGLQQVFGEFDEMGVSSEPQSAPVSPVPPQKMAVWEDWKKKLGGASAKIIDILHLHGELSQDQLRIHVGTSRIQTIYDAVSKLNKAGIINKNGGKISLKEL